MNEGLIDAENDYEKGMLEEWNFALNTPMQAALNGFRSGYRAANNFNIKNAQPIAAPDSTCPECGGGGMIIVGDTEGSCFQCNGTGRTR